ncbi:MAG: hypothetical protein AAFU70_14130, partial [Planctomycetota bacterium]
GGSKSRLQTTVSGTPRLVSGAANAVTGGYSFQVALGLVDHESQARTLLTGTTAITAGGDVSVLGFADTAAFINSVSSNILNVLRSPLGLFDDVNGQSLSIAVALSFGDTVSRVRLGEDASIVSTGGNVNVKTDTLTDSYARALVNSYVDGFGGVTTSLSQTLTKSETLIDGRIDAAGAPDGAVAGSFNPGSAVSLADDTITIPDHGFVDGQRVIYTASDSSVFERAIGGFDAIGGLEDGRTYFVDVVDKDTVRLAQEPWLDLSENGLLDGSTQKLARIDARFFSLNAVDPDEDLILVEGHGLADGETVVYGGDGEVIEGLAKGATYRIAVEDENAFALEDAT